MISQRNGGDGRNTTKAQKADIMAIEKVIYRRWVDFLMRLNRGEPCSMVGSFFNELERCDNICSVVGSFFNELEPCDNTCSVVGSFFNELEPCDNICSIFSFSFYVN